MAESPSFAPIEVYLTVSGGLEAIAFYEKAFGATPAFQQMAEDGKRLLHATLSVFGAQIMLSDHFPEHGNDVAAPPMLGGTTVTVHVNLNSPAEVDAAMARAARAGATVTMPASDTFWDMRYGRLKDPFGHSWSLGAPLPSKTEGRFE
ncbi:VOC family protein [Phreatobacter stygius]|uniref:VOC family protein n=1 Tax=Phreatobacter stygius TaxID=1940610 RepID=A0A4D7B6W8_9HYPH|nr:VOC family protein [Phreatobacter stygius]QCI66118.1 VOC family protein [Phreatobacter stygius]